MNVIFGTGPLGQAVAVALTARGEKARLVNRSGRAPGGLSGTEVVAGDLSDKDSARRAARGCSVLYHCAAAPYSEWPETLPALKRIQMQRPWLSAHLILAHVILALALCLAACSALGEDRPGKIQLKVQGVVTSSSGNTPIADALVILGAGGYFTLPGSLDSVATSPEGRYRIERSITDPADTFGGCQYWLSAAADGFMGTPRGSADGAIRVGCTERLQTINIKLKPF